MGDTAETPDLVPPPYPFDEFRGHLRAMPVVRGYTEARFTYAEEGRVMLVGDDKGMVPSSLRVMDYFAQNYPDSKERTYKFGSFMLTLWWVGDHKEQLVARGLARPSPDGDGTTEFRESLMCAALERVLADRARGDCFETIVRRSIELRAQFHEED